MGRAYFLGCSIEMLGACGAAALASPDVTIDGRRQASAAEWRAARALTETAFKWTQGAVIAGNNRSDAAGRDALVQLVTMSPAPSDKAPASPSTELARAIAAPVVESGEAGAPVVIGDEGNGRTELVKQSLTDAGQDPHGGVVGTEIRALPWARTYVVTRHMTPVAGGWTYDLKSTDAPVALSSIGSQR